MPDVQWQVGEGTERETIANSPSARRSRRGWMALFIVVILGVALGAWYRSLPEPAPRPTSTPSPTPQPSPTRPALPAKLYATIDQEAQALADGDIKTYLALLA